MTYAHNMSERGARYEQIAALFLEKVFGYEILEMNFKSRFGEIDIIAKDAETLVFIEVKYRKSSSFGYPEEFVNLKKQHKILQTARYFMLKSHSDVETPIRFDVVSILGDKIKVIKDAFQCTM